MYARASQLKEYKYFLLMAAAARAAINVQYTIHMK